PYTTLFRSGGRQGRVLESDGDAIIPARVFGHVVRRRINLHGHHATALHAPLQQGVVVLEEQLQELLLLSPLHLVVVLHRVRLVGGNLGRGTLSGQGAREHRQTQSNRQRLHLSSSASLKKSDETHDATRHSSSRGS